MAGRGEREVKIRFTGESTVLKGATGEVRKVFQMLQSDLNDTRSASEKLAAAQSQVADSMRKDMAAIATAADTVRDSLGPEMTQAIEASGRTVEDQVQDWRKLGLTLDEITMDSDKLAAGLKQLDDAARQSTGAVGDGMRKIGDSSNAARGAMSNFAGNAIAELPGVASALGPLNQGISQLTEGLAEGDLNFKQLLTAGLAMAAVSVVMSEISKHQKEIAEAKAWRTENIDAFVDSIRNGENAAEALAQRLEEAGEIQVKFAGVMKGQGGDLTETLAEAGVTIEQFTRAATGGDEGLRSFRDALDAAGVSADDAGKIMLGAASYQDQHNQAIKTAAELSKVYGDVTADTTDELDRGADALGGHMDATTAATLAQESLTAATEAAEQAIRDLADAHRSSIDAGYAAADAQDQFVTAMEALAVATDDPKTGVNELDQAQRGAAQAALDMAAANQANAEQMALSSGVPLDAAAGHKVFMDSLYMLAMSLDANSPVRAALLAHIETLGGMPPTVATKVDVDVTDAHERIGGVQEAVDELDGTETNTKSNAETDTALTRVETLTLAVEGVPGTIPIDVVLTGDADTKRRIGTLIDELQRLINKANEADRVVARVAG